MKLLLSAYACEPDKGSEPGVGWNWAQALARRGYEVHVLTRSNNRPSIEAALAQVGSTLRFVYFDLPAWSRGWKYWPGGIYLYYLLWQLGAYHLAKRLHAVERFDCVQHITFVSFRQPSFMGGLGIPFLFGPVGGGEAMPPNLLAGIPWTGRLAEAVRGLGNALVALDPLMRSTFARARTIACTTVETKERVPALFRSKCVVQPAIGIDASEIRPITPNAIIAPQFVYVGRLLYWKGLHLALRALPVARETVPDIRLKIIGSGNDRSWLKKVERDAGVADSTEWVSEKPHDQIWQEYRESTAFVFPSLHDSGGMVVLEALAAGLPVICLDLGGPGTNVTPDCGVVVESKAESEDAVVRRIAEAMILLSTDPGYRARLSAGAVVRAQQKSWDAAVDAVYASLLSEVNPEVRLQSVSL